MEPGGDGADWSVQGTAGSHLQLSLWSLNSDSDAGLNLPRAFRTPLPVISRENPSSDGAASSPGHMPIDLNVVPSRTSSSPADTSSPNAIQPDSPEKKRKRPGTDGDSENSNTSSPLTPGSPSVVDCPLEERIRGQATVWGSNEESGAARRTATTNTASEFTPHAITVPARQDIAREISPFSQQRIRGVCPRRELVNLEGDGQRKWQY